MCKVGLALFLLPLSETHAQVPANNGCANAQPLPVIPNPDCPFGGVNGTNVNATQDGPAPLCDPDGVFPDVWYTIQTGPDTLINIFIAPGPLLTDHGITVYDGCGGPEVACGIAPQLSYDVEVLPNHTYLVRVATNTDFGNTGTFLLCASYYPPQPVCDGNIIKTFQGELTFNACIDGASDVMGVNTFSTASGDYSFLLATAGDSLVTVMNGNELDADTLAPGIYHVWGLSHEGALLNADPGVPVADIISDGQCWELSTTTIVLTADICSAMEEFAALDFQVHPNPNEGVFTVVMDPVAGPVDLIVRDMTGRVLHQEQWNARNAATRTIALPGLPQGAYLLELRSGAGSGHRRVIVR